MTHERELSEPVDLCTPDGARLNPSALGWSRRPLHRANLGPSPANKRWDYWAVLAGDVVVSALVSDLTDLGLADVWWAEPTTGRQGGRGILAGGGELRLPDVVGAAPLVASGEGLSLSIEDDQKGTGIVATWSEPDGRDGELEVVVAAPEGHESLNVVVPWSDELFNFTSKHQARPATGRLRVGDREWAIGVTDDAWGVLDVGRGRWPSVIRWNWGGGAGRVDGRVVGLQVGGRWTEGTGATENGVLVDGRLTKLGEELRWTYDWSDPMTPWRVVDPGGHLDAVLTPRFDKHTHLDAGERGSETHQVFGTWAGWLATSEGERIDFERLEGFAEEARQRW